MCVGDDLGEIRQFSYREIECFIFSTENEGREKISEINDGGNIEKDGHFQRRTIRSCGRKIVSIFKTFLRCALGGDVKKGVHFQKVDFQRITFFQGPHPIHFVFWDRRINVSYTCVYHFF